MIRPGFPRCTLSWREPGFGTGPFSTGFNFGDSESSGDLALVAAAVIDVWNADTTVLGYLYSELGPLTVECAGEYGGNIEVHSEEAAAVSTGSAPGLPGVSARILMGGSRPGGGRRGCMYLPGLEDSGYSDDGEVVTLYRTNLTTWANDIREAVEGAFVGAFMATLHNVDGVESWSVVNALACANSVSFLRKRYR